MVFLYAHGVGTSRAVRIYKTYGAGRHRAHHGEPLPAGARHPRHRLRHRRRARPQARHREDGAHPRPGRHQLRTRCRRWTRDSAACRARSWSGSAQKLLDVPDGDRRAGAARPNWPRAPWWRTPPTAATCVFLAWLHTTERQLADRIRRCPAERRRWAAIDVGEGHSTGSSARSASRWPTASAKRSGRRSRSKMLVITGGPGVGKTTIVRAILAILGAKRVRVALCAPTGRAAKRLSEVTGLEAKTIHRLLEVNPADGRFRRGPRRARSTATCWWSTRRRWWTCR